MKIAELYRCVLLTAADNVDNYPDVFSVEEIQVAFDEIQAVIEAIRDRSDEWLDDFQIMRINYEAKYLRDIFRDVYTRGNCSYIDIMLEYYADNGEF